jgi:ABC-type glycerol-3-phosphate transport system substrate-binding protein
MIREATPPDVRVNVITVSRPSLHHVLTQAVAEGQAPDLALVDSVWLAEFADRGFLHALEDLDERWVRDEHETDFLGPLVKANRYAGKTFGVSAFADVAGVWYRREELAAAGVDPPETWAELRTAARAVARNGIPHPIAIPGGTMGGETTAYCLIAFLASNGAHVLGPDGVTLDSPATAQALRFLRRLVEDAVMPVEVVGYEWDRPLRLLADGQAAMSFGGSYEAKALAERLGVPLRELWDRVGFVAMPAGPQGAPASVLGTMVYSIFRQAAQPRLAMRLLRGIVEPEVVARIARATGRVPSRRSAVELAVHDLPFLEQTAAMLELAVPRPATPVYPRVSAQLQAMLEATLTGRLGPARAAQRTADLVGAITGLPVVHERELEPAKT